MPAILHYGVLALSAALIAGASVLFVARGEAMLLDLSAALSAFTCL